MSLELAIALALTFAVTNGFHDAANAIATLVATHGASALQAILLCTVANLAGALLIGSAVADTIAGIVQVDAADAVTVIGAGTLAAVTWNVLTWLRGLPSSSAHALVGGLVGAAIAEGGTGGVAWGGLDGWRPVGVVGVLVALAVSPLLGFAAGFGLARANRRVLRRATTRVGGPVRAASWGMTTALAFSHGGNDAQKAMGVVAALLLASGHLDALSVPLWVKVSCALALTLGTATGGWRIVHTIGRQIFRLVPVDGLASQSGSAVVILGASLAGAPVSTTQVVASSVVGIGAGRRRWRHVHWLVVRATGSAWLLTLPASALAGAAAYAVWSAL
jgi:PiT family inorganic phosphate transporter